MRKSEGYTEPVAIDEHTARDLMRILLRADRRSHDLPNGKAYIQFGFDEHDALALERHAQRLGVTAKTLARAAAALCLRQAEPDRPLPAPEVEYLAKHGIAILRKRDLS
jgi:hypothetical protein